MYAAKVPESYERQVFCIKDEVYNEFHIIWEPFQTPIFQLYKALHEIFQNTTKKSQAKTQDSLEIVNKKREFFHKITSSQYFLIGGIFWP